MDRSAVFVDAGYLLAAGGRLTCAEDEAGHRCALKLANWVEDQQKGVDALIYRDLMTLARERAIACAYLLSGDEDLREGVVAAQDMGVQVVLLGIPSSRANQSAALIREADEHVVLPKEHWSEHFSSRAAGRSAGQVTSTPAAAQTAGRAFAISWAKNASGEDLDKLLDVQPKIPTELDVAMLVEAEETVGPLRERQDLKRELRAAFWAEVRAAKDALVAS